MEGTESQGIDPCSSGSEGVLVTQRRSCKVIVDKLDECMRQLMLPYSRSRFQFSFIIPVPVLDIILLGVGDTR